MSSITILRTRGAPLEQVDEDVLIKRAGVVRDDDDYTITVVEFCLLDCQGRAHGTGVPDSVAHFCDAHVHRSVDVVAKRYPVMAGVASAFT